MVMAAGTARRRRGERLFGRRPVATRCNRPDGAGVIQMTHFRRGRRRRDVGRLHVMDTKPAAGANPDPSELVDTFRVDQPKLADAIDQAQRTAEIVDAYDRSREPALRYTVSTGTTST